MKIEVLLPEVCFVECAYVAKVFFEQILGVDYFLGRSHDNDFHLRVPNGKLLSFKNVFWTQYGRNYLRKKCIPISISFFEDSEKHYRIPILFGDSTIENTPFGLYYGADIFASAFFMLSRWEEMVQPDDCDLYCRFPAYKAIAVKHSFITVPVVNCYAEIIKQQLAHFGYNFDIKNKFKIQLTVDIDNAQRWSGTKDFIFSVASTVIRRRQLLRAIRDIGDYLSQKDTYDNFSKLARLAQSYDCGIRWFLLCTDKNIRFFQSRNELTEMLFANENELGFHPSIAAVACEADFVKESELLHKLVGQKVFHNRFHYLCGSVPNSWHVLEKYGFKSDSSMYYTESPGFRTGCCTPHSLFSVAQNRELQVIEEPLMVMDASLLYGDRNAIINSFDEIKRQCHQHGGLFTVLWHNSSFGNEWSELFPVLERMLSNDI